MPICNHCEREFEPGDECTVRRDGIVYEPLPCASGRDSITFTAGEPAEGGLMSIKAPAED